MVWGDLIGALRRLWQAAMLVGALCALGVVAGCGGGVGVQAAERDDRACAAAVLDDWGENGQVDERYDDGCYLAAIDTLPEDVRAYTSAADDILRALHAQRPNGGEDSGARSLASAGTSGALTRALASERLEPSEPAATSAFRVPPAPVLLLGALGLAVAVALALPTTTRRARRRS